MHRGPLFPPAEAMLALGSLIACCDECSVEWDIGVQPSGCHDGNHEWTLRVA